MSVARAEEEKDQTRVNKVPFDHPQPRFIEPQPIIDASSDFEEMDRGNGWGIDDKKTYCRTEK